MFKVQYSNPADMGAVDTATIGIATKTIDFAAYALDDPRIVTALVARAIAGVKVRIYLDRTELKASASKVASLAACPIGPLMVQGNITILVKSSTVLMHMKSYCVDNSMLRDGSTNFSVPGEELQDNSLTLTDDPTAIAAFNAKFATMWSRADNLSPNVAVQFTPHASFHAARHSH